MYTFFLVFLISTAFLEVASWTIDLPEARKYFFEKSDHDRNINETVIKDEFYFDNIVPDSPHNKEELEEHSENENRGSKDSQNDVFGGGYAKDFEYMSYMEKKVHNIVHNGSVYLEGLRQALEDYGELLVNCSRMNFTQPTSPTGPWLPQNERQNPGPSTSYPPHNPLSESPALPGQGSQISQNPAPSPEPIFTSAPLSSSNQILGNNNSSSSTESPRFAFRQLLNRTVTREVCERATMASEHVRRLAQLSLWATRELQDRAYNDKYNKAHHTDEEEEEEAELLLRLAFFLDRLAYYTGYEPEARDYIRAGAERPLTTTQPPPSILGSVPDDVKMAMLGCLQLNSSDDAVVRCRYPLRYPQFMTRLFNVTDPPEAVEGLFNEEIQNAKDPSFREVYRNPVPPSRQKRDILTDTITFDSEIKEQGIDRESQSVKRDMSNGQENLTAENNLTVNSQKQQVLQGLARILQDTVVPVTVALQNTLKPISSWLQDIKLMNLSSSFANLTANLQNLTDNLTSGIKNFTNLVDITQTLTSINLSNNTEINDKSNFVNIDSDSQEKVETSSLTADIVTSENPPKSLVVTRKKRSIDDHPLQHFFNYYAKHKAWVGSNTENLPSNFDVSNHLTPVKTVKIHKRSIDNKKMTHLLPENPMQDISDYVKHATGVNYIKNQAQKEKIEYYISKIRSNSNSKSSKLFLQKILKSRHKRAVEFEKKKLPSQSENPRQDISYYEKNKFGTNYQNNLVQAGQVRAGLEQVYQTGNILVVQRYGSNFNPLIPFPLGFGIARTAFGDI